MEIEMFKTFGESALDLHQLGGLSMIILMVYLYFLVQKATRPVIKAIENLVISNNAQDTMIKIHEGRLDDHGRALEVHEKRIVVLETDKQTKGE